MPSLRWRKAYSALMPSSTSGQFGLGWFATHRTRERQGLHSIHHAHGTDRIPGMNNF